MSSHHLATVLVPMLCLTVGCGGPAEKDAQTATCVDEDGDSYGANCDAGPDCDDGNAAVNPGADDSTTDGKDTNCDGVPGVDADGDGFASKYTGGRDCDDTNPDVHPDAEEKCDGNDNACNGGVPANEQDRDGDGKVACSPWDDTQGDNPDITGGGDTYDADMTDPTGSITSPADGAYVTSDSVQVSSDDAADIGSGLAEVVFTLSQGDTSLEKSASGDAPFNVSFDSSGLAEGEATVALRLVDNNGNTATDTISVFKDTERPTGELTKPTDGDYVGGQLAVAANASDATAGVAQVTFTLDDGTTSLATTVGSPFTAQFDTTQLENDAEATLTLDVTDAAGLTAATPADSLTVTIDNSGNAELSGLEVDGESVYRFDPRRPSFNESVGSGKDSVTVTATTAKPGAALSVGGEPARSGETTGPHPLSYGNNLIPVDVTSVDGASSRNYELTVCRPYSKLDSLELNGTPVPDFAPNDPDGPGDNHYQMQIHPDAADAITIEATSKEPNPIIEYAVPDPNARGGQRFEPLATPLELPLGTTTVTVRATGCNGSSQKYKVDVTVPAWTQVGGDTLPMRNLTSVGGQLVGANGTLYAMVHHDSTQSGDQARDLSLFRLDGGSWTTERTDIASENVEHADFDVAADGSIVVAYRYVDDADDRYIEAKKKPAAESWTGLGKVVQDAVANPPPLAVAAGEGGDAYVALADPTEDDKLSVRTHTIAWGQVGMRGFSDTQPSVLDLNLDANATPYVAGDAWTGGGAEVYKADAGSWAAQGSPTTGAVEYVTLGVAPSDVPYLSYVAAGQNATPVIESFDGGWSDIGLPSAVPERDYKDSLPMAFPQQGDSDAQVLVAYHEVTPETVVQVAGYDGSDWEAISHGFPVSDTAPLSIALADGTLYVGYLDDVEEAYKVMRFHGALPHASN